VETFLHEFGHSLHGLLTKCTYPSQSGTNVARDFVELPSQFNENFLGKKEFLDTFATHWETGEAIPQELIDRLQEAGNFQAGYLCLRQLSFGMLDMAYHSLGRKTDAARPEVQDLEKKPLERFPELEDVLAFEKSSNAPTNLLPVVEGTMTSPTFTHIFSGGYAAGYYGYKWAEVLDADAFAVFEREGLSNPKTAQRFRHLLESGDTVDPAELYREFKGADPTVEALMRRDGIIK
jgi:peptidyl-dipeptidase Dcp